MNIMATSKNGVGYTHSTYIQDIELIEDFGLGRSDASFITISGKAHILRFTANPGVWYIDNPLEVKVGDEILMEPDRTHSKKYRVVDIGEYAPQPTLRTLYMVIP